MKSLQFSCCGKVTVVQLQAARIVGDKAHADDGLFSGQFICNACKATWTFLARKHNQAPVSTSPHGSVALQG